MEVITYCTFRMSSRSDTSHDSASDIEKKRVASSNDRILQVIKTLQWRISNTVHLLAGVLLPRQISFLHLLFMISFLQYGVMFSILRCLKNFFHILSVFILIICINILQNSSEFELCPNVLGFISKR